LEKSARFSNIKKIFSSRYTFVAVCFLILTVMNGAQSTFGVFFKPMSQEFGWSRALTAGPVSVVLLAYGLFSILMGRLKDRFALWKLATVGAVVAGLGFTLMSTVHNIWELYIYYGIFVAFGMAATWVPLVSSVANLFTLKRGLMSGITIAGVACGIGVMPPIASQLIVSFKWRIGALVLGIIIVVSIVILAQLLRFKPESEPEREFKHDNSKSSPSAPRSFSLREIMRLKEFWFLLIVWMLWGVPFQVVAVHIIPYGTDMGLSAVAAATILTTVGLVGIAGRIAMGYVGDRLGNRVTAFACFLLIALAFVGLMLTHSVGFLFVFAVCFGILSGVSVLLIPLVAEYFGFKELGVVSGIAIFTNSIGGAISPPLAGAIYDRTQNYHLAFLLCFATMLAAAIVTWLFRPRGINRIVK